ncbi:MAG: threonine aldolase family protein [Phycisphaerae bacterium]
MANIVDLRSDTVTRPSPAMRQAIANAEVGDDVLGDDPTVIRLQQRSAELLGKEAALYVPSGSMANMVSIRSVCEAGDEIICDDTTHSYNYETAGPAALAGVSMKLIDGPRGLFTPDQVIACLRPRNAHSPRSRMTIIENTNNRGGGTIWPIEQVTAVASVSHEHGLHVHMDGARLMNACVASGRKPVEYTRHVDTVSMCFSKGLGAPVGSIVAGSQPFIERCQRFRKQFGGAMRQAGILAAAALYALDHNVERLADDHASARRFAQGIESLPGIKLDRANVQTNIVIFEVERALGTADEFADKLRKQGVWMFAMGPSRLRAVTHLDVSVAQIDQAIAAFRNICAAVAV